MSFGLKVQHVNGQVLNKASVSSFTSALPSISKIGSFGTLIKLIRILCTLPKCQWWTDLHERNLYYDHWQFRLDIFDGLPFLLNISTKNCRCVNHKPSPAAQPKLSNTRIGTTSCISSFFSFLYSDEKTTKIVKSTNIRLNACRG